jgi:hypothetical protein
VRVYSITDAEYLQGVYTLDEGGTWTSGNEIVRAGKKIATVVCGDDGKIVAVSGEPATAISGVQVAVYSRTDADSIQEIVPLSADGSWRMHADARPGTKIARVVRTVDGRVLNSTEWSDAEPFRGLVRSFFLPQDDPDYATRAVPLIRAGIGSSSDRSCMTAP